nr:MULTISPECIES: GNAT family N-acetyltransferase [unclassified Devosia]
MAWDDSGLALLEALNTPEEKQHLGGPESAAKTLDRHRRYLTYHQPGEVEMLRIAAGDDIVGSVGYWARNDRAETDYEMGWELLPAVHGRGYGTAAARALLERLQPLARYRYVYAYPTPINAGSNGICRKLGFELTGVEDFEYPKGVVSPHNVWRLDLPSWTPPAA